ncbi:uncharacterized protein LOC144131579 [Amblyomma americanum]|uniref:Uncharacterized protein n=1 Tax=Amblyomma americanum TaxID=6943 RepID=A0AAQ4E8C8_AMBAM
MASWTVSYSDATRHHPQRTIIQPPSNKYISFWLLGSLSAALLLLVVLLGCCTRRLAHRARRASREQVHVLPGGNAAPRLPPGRPRLPVGDPHSREILLCPACRSAQEEMFQTAKAAPAAASPARWSPPPPYSPSPTLLVQPHTAGAHSHL